MDVKSTREKSNPDTERLARQARPKYAAWLRAFSQLWYQRKSIIADPSCILSPPLTWKSPFVFALALVAVPCIVFEFCGWFVGLILPQHAPLSLAAHEEVLQLSQRMASMAEEKNDTAASGTISKVQDEINQLKADSREEGSQTRLVSGASFIDECIAFPIGLWIGGSFFQWLISCLRNWDKTLAVGAKQVYFYYYPACAFWFLIVMYAGLSTIKLTDMCQLPQLQNQLADDILTAAELVLPALPLIPIFQHASKISRLLRSESDKSLASSPLVVGVCLFVCVYIADLCRVAALYVLAMVWMPLASSLVNY